MRMPAFSGKKHSIWQAPLFLCALATELEELGGSKAESTVTFQDVEEGKQRKLTYVNPHTAVVSL